MRLLFSADAAKLLPPSLALSSDNQQQKQQQHSHNDTDERPITIISSEPKWRLDYGQVAALADVDPPPLHASYLPILDMQWTRLIADDVGGDANSDGVALAVACGGGGMVLDLATAACLQVCSYSACRVVDRAVVACQVYDETFGILASLPTLSHPLQFFATHAPRAIK